MHYAKLVLANHSASWCINSIAGLTPLPGEDGFDDEVDGDLTVAEQADDSKGDEHEAYKKLCRGEEIISEK